MQNYSDKEIHGIIKTWREKIKLERYPARATFGNYKIDNGEIVHTSEQLIVYPFMLDDNGALILKFKSCNKMYIIDIDFKLNSFHNFPETIYGPNERFLNYGIKVAYSTHKNIPLDGITKTFMKSCSFWKFPNVNLSNVHKHIKYVGETFSINPNYKNPILGVLLIEGIKDFIGVKSIEPILNKHLQGDRDILECQEELIDNGFKEYARL